MRALFVAALSALVLLPPPPARAAGDPAAGRKAFAACISCHQAGPSARHAFGPQLNSLAGRKAGTLAGYAYSPALTSSGLVWNEATLAAYLRDPNGLVPGTKMRFWGVGMNERKAADLLAYLAAAPQR
ncbi:c-type cytochrome [Roseateles sp. DC23W]|uniref:C-type cytochrome n=1 Tax=Pelomonas dachongensis TaxID=3299029 RepID=A0ABW7EGB9_9BURK